MGDFKFLDQNIPDEPEETQLPMVIRDPSVVFRLNRHRDTISDQEWDSILEHQRRTLMKFMWEQGMIMQTIIYQDENGFSLRTELLF